MSPKKLFEHVDPVGQDLRILGQHYTVIGTIAKKGRVLGQSFDGFVLLRCHIRDDLRPTKNQHCLGQDASALLVASGMERANERCGSRTTCGPAMSQLLGRAAMRSSSLEESYQRFSFR